MRVGNSMLAVLGLALVFGPPSAAIAQTQALNPAQAEKLTTDSSAARAMIESGGTAELAWNWFVWLKHAADRAAGRKHGESWRPSSSVYLPKRPAASGLGTDAGPPPAAVIAPCPEGGPQHQSCRSTISTATCNPTDLALARQVQPERPLSDPDEPGHVHLHRQ